MSRRLSNALLLGCLGLYALETAGFPELSAGHVCYGAESPPLRVDAKDDSSSLAWKMALDELVDVSVGPLKYDWSTPSGSYWIDALSDLDDSYSNRGWKRASYRTGYVKGWRNRLAIQYCELRISSGGVHFSHSFPLLNIAWASKRPYVLGYLAGERRAMAMIDRIEREVRDREQVLLKLAGQKKPWKHLVVSYQAFLILQDRINNGIGSARSSTPTPTARSTKAPSSFTTATRSPCSSTRTTRARRVKVLSRCSSP